ncbi:hypothetical protein ACVNP0_11365 [Staphylococcus aureus]
MVGVLVVVLQSLASYLFEIRRFDPIKFNLLFERFFKHRTCNNA